MDRSINIELVRNGFIVWPPFRNGYSGTPEDAYVFNTPEELSKHVALWAALSMTEQARNREKADTLNKKAL